jgi:O-antigen/teichoic acid export membrane protein
LAVIIFSRELGASPLGTYFPFIALLGIMAIPADFGVRSATEKRISEGDNVGKYLGSAVVIKIPLLILFAVGAYLSSPYINKYLGADLTLLLVATLLAHEFGKLSLSVLRGELRAGETAVAELVQPLCWLLVGYLLYLEGYGVFGLVYGYLLGTVLMGFIGWWKLSVPIGKPSVDHIQSLLNYGRFSMITTVGGYFYSWVDVAILTLFVALEITSSRANIGAYESAWRLSLIVVMLGQSIGTVIFPQFSRWDAEDTTHRIENAIPKALLPSLLISIPAFFGVLMLSDSLLRILFGSEFTVASLALVILTGEKILQSIHIILGRSLGAINRPDLAARATIVTISINIVLNLVLIWMFGIVGAAIATTVSFSINTVLHGYYLDKFLNINFPTDESMWALCASVLMCISIYIIRSFQDVSGVADLIIIIILSIIIYTLILLQHNSIRITAQRLAKSATEHLIS